MKRQESAKASKSLKSHADASTENKVETKRICVATESTETVRNCQGKQNGETKSIKSKDECNLCQ